MTAISEELSDALTFADLRFANEARQAHWGGTDNWTLSDWSNAVAGEVGEACNIVKKIRRPELGTTGNSEDVSALYPKLESEIGDVLVYLDLLAKKAGTTLDRCVMRAFNEKSEALGMPVRLQSLRSGNGGEVRVRKLEWRGDFAHTGMGLMYHIDHKTGVPGLVILEKIAGASTTKSAWDTLEAAQKHADEHWRSLVLSALDIKP